MEDSILKQASELFASELLPCFGIQEKVIAVKPSEMITLHIERQYMDYIFLTADDVLHHFEFQSTDGGEQDLVRFQGYEAVLHMKTGKPVITHVIYSGDIKHPKSECRSGINTYRVHAISMCNKDGNAVLERIDKKLKSGEKISREDMLELVLVPLMGGESGKAEKIRNAILLTKDMETQEMPETKKVQAMLYAFAEKFLQGTELKTVQEVLSMTRLGQMLMEQGEEKGLQEGLQEGMQKGMQKGIQKGMQKGMQKGLEKGLQKGIQKGISEGRQEAIVRMLKKLSPKEIVELGYDMVDVQEVMKKTKK